MYLIYIYIYISGNLSDSRQHNRGLKSQRSKMGITYM